MCNHGQWFSEIQAVPADQKPRPPILEMFSQALAG
jgi:hypothetical protein